jgi:hypothetical protein
MNTSNLADILERVLDKGIVIAGDIDTTDPLLRRMIAPDRAFLRFCRLRRQGWPLSRRRRNRRKVRDKRGPPKKWVSSVKVAGGWEEA